MGIEHIAVNGRELTAFDLPPEPTGEYTVDACGNVERVPTYDQLERENAELRELVKKAYAFIETLCEIVENSPGCFMCPANQDEDNPCGSAVIYGRMLDLGIEVGW